MRALSIRQPYAELILRGTCGERIKLIEFRSRPTKIVGERFYIYASRQRAAGKLYLHGDTGWTFYTPNTVVSAPVNAVAGFCTVAQRILLPIAAISSAVYLFLIERLLNTRESRGFEVRVDQNAN